MYYCMCPDDLQSRLAGAQWVVLSALRGFAEDGVEVLEVKSEACVGTLSLTFLLFVLCLFRQPGCMCQVVH